MEDGCGSSGIASGGTYHPSAIYPLHRRTVHDSTGSTWKYPLRTLKCQGCVRTLSGISTGVSGAQMSCYAMGMVREDPEILSWARATSRRTPHVHTNLPTVDQVAEFSNALHAEPRRHAFHVTPSPGLWYAAETDCRPQVEYTVNGQTFLANDGLSETEARDVYVAIYGMPSWRSWR